MVTISRTVDLDGTWYQIEDFDKYVGILREHNIEPPEAKYRVFVPSATGDEFQRLWGDVKDQICLFFRLGPTVGIPYEIVDQPARTPSAQ
jgi:hypothetical protein